MVKFLGVFMSKGRSLEEALEERRLPRNLKKIKNNALFWPWWADVGRRTLGDGR